MMNDMGQAVLMRVGSGRCVPGRHGPGASRGFLCQQHSFLDDLQDYGWATPRSVCVGTASWPRRIKIFLALPTCSCYLWRTAQRRDSKKKKKSHLHTEAANAGVGAEADLDVETLQVRTQHWNLLEVSINIQYKLISICVLIVLWFAWLTFNNIYCFFVFLLDYKCDMQQY